MTPQIALDLSLDGITVLSRAPDGGWWREGTVRLDQQDMPDRLAALHGKAEARVGPGFTSILILPDSQLLYTSLERDDRKPDDTIRALLKGRTPYPVEDLTFDHVLRGDRLQVAVVALETLLEAETFADEYGFRPVAVVANPQDPAYPGIPNFGKTGLADEVLRGEPLNLDIGDGFKITTAPPLPEPKAPDVAAVPAPPPVAAAPAPEPPAAPKAVVEAIPPEAPAEPPAPPAPPKAAPEPEAPVSFKRAKPAAPTPPVVPTPVAKPDPQVTAPSADAEPAPAAPPQEDAVPLPSISFASRRTSDAAKVPEARTAAGERLAKVAPRLSPPPLAPPRAAAAPKGPAPDGEEAPAQKRKVRAPKIPVPGRKRAKKAPAPKVAAPKPPVVDAPAPEPITAAPKPVVAPVTRKPNAGAGGLAALAQRLKKKQAEEKAQKAAQAEAADADRQTEAAALALPGLARERATAGPKSTARLGLILTLGLLATLAAIGAGAVLLGPSETTDDATEAQVDQQIAALPEAEPAPEPIVQVPAAAPDGVTAPAPLVVVTPEALIEEEDSTAEAAESDLASLLPLSDDEQALPDPNLVPDVVSAPLPLSDIPLASDLNPEPQSEDQILPEIAPDLALAPALDSAPVAEIEPAVFTEPFTSAGSFVVPSVPAPPQAGEEAPTDTLTLAALDPAIVSSRAQTLLRPEAPADQPRRQINPPPAEQAGDADAARGLVTATPEGVVAPGGYTVVLGRPVVVPPPRPGGVNDVPQATAPVEPEADTPAEAPTEDAVAEDSAPDATAPEDAVATAPEEATTEDTAARADAEDQATEGVDSEALAILRRIRPIIRPAEIAEQAERASNGGLLRQELLRTRPRQRPAAIEAAAQEAAAAIARAQEEAAAVTAAQQAAAASLASSEAADLAAAAAAAVTGTTEADDGPISELALRASERPRGRPRSVEREAARIVTQRRERAAASTAPDTSASTPPARTVDRAEQPPRSAGGNVARAATERNVLRLNQINLIGVYGRPNARRALVRLSNGRYVKVEVGDRLDRGRVTAIGEGELSYQRGGRNVVLRLPRA